MNPKRNIESDRPNPDAGIDGNPGSVCRLYWRESVAGVVSALAMAHGGGIGIWAGAVVFVWMIAVGFYRESFLWFALALSLYPLPSAPVSVTVKEGVFALALGCFFLRSAWMCRAGAIRGRRTRIWWILILIAGYLIVNFISARQSEVSFSEWFRGLAPFLLIGIGFPVFLVLKENPGFVRGIILSGILLASLFVFRVLLVYVQEELWEPREWVYLEPAHEWIRIDDENRDQFPVSSIQEFAGRVTHVLPQSTDVLVLLAIIWGMDLCCWGAKRRILMGSLVAILGTAAVTLTHTRSMILTITAIVFCITGYLLLFHRKRLWRFGIGVLSVVATFLIIAVSLNLGDVLSDRFQQLVSSIRSGSEGANVTARLEEYKIAWEMFIESPVLGKGLGVTHKMRFDAGFGSILEQEVAYIHNWPLYFLSVGGVIGLLLYLIIIVAPLVLVVRSHAFRSYIGLGIYTTMGCLVCFALFFAVFRLLSFNIVLGCLGGISFAWWVRQERQEVCVE